jgi:hypothetical protein
MLHSQTVSINTIRADATCVMRGNLGLCLLAGGLLFIKITPMLRILPRIDMAPLRSPLVWLLTVLTIAAAFAGRFGTARMTALYLWIFIGCVGVIVIGSIALVVIWARVAQPEWPDESAVVDFARDRVGLLLGIVALILILIVTMLALFYWLFMSPARAAVRLLAARLPLDGTPLQTVLSSTVLRRHARPAPASQKTPFAAIAYMAVAVTLGIVAAVVTGWLLGSDSLLRKAMSDVLVIAAIMCVATLWRRGRKHAAVDDYGALSGDPRRRVLYLRSFQDDPDVVDQDWDLLTRFRFSRGGSPWRGPLARLGARMTAGMMSATGGRLEETTAKVVAPIGPLVAVGKPDEALPQLGAARAYLPRHNWQTTIIQWMDTAELIVLVAGPTSVGSVGVRHQHSPRSLD